MKSMNAKHESQVTFTIINVADPESLTRIHGSGLLLNLDPARSRPNIKKKIFFF
jgi:hypothetical protein